LCWPAVVIVVGIGGASGATTKHKTTPKKINLSGVTLNVGDLAGRPRFCSTTLVPEGRAVQSQLRDVPAGPPAVAAIQGGSIDLTVTADTPAIFAQAGGVALKVVAVTQPVAPGASLASLFPRLDDHDARRIEGHEDCGGQRHDSSVHRDSGAQWLRRGLEERDHCQLNPALALAALTSNSSRRPS